MNKSELRHISKDFNSGNLNNFAQGLASLIQEYGVSEFVARSGLSRGTLFRYMKGKGLRVDALYRVLDTLGIKIQLEADKRMGLIAAQREQSKATQECEYYASEMAEQFED